ncbi:amidohydrolase [Streptomyces sp. NPDC001508]|uniref:amidohydrolase n=1 Tax=Streptomyces sp. NPDC001508 TaxID=3154656 RepID=UPI00331661E7
MESGISRRNALRLGAAVAAGTTAVSSAGVAAADSAAVSSGRVVDADSATPVAPGGGPGASEREWDTPASWQKPEPVDLLVYNGRLVTVDHRFSIEQAMAVRDGLIVAVGPDADLRKRFTGSQEIDLRGQTVLPGFNDAHSHARTFSHRSIGDLQSATSIKAMRDLLAAKTGELGKGKWITGSGYDETIFAEGRKPTRQDLDEGAPDNPVHLYRQGGHSSVANSLALKIAGIDKNTPDPKGGRIERDENGEATGVLVETAGDLVHQHVPSLGPEEEREGTVAGLKSYLRLGITSFTDAMGSVDTFKKWRAIYDELGADLPRASYYVTCTTDIPAGIKPFEGDDRLRAVALKVFADGGFTGPDARLTLPYKGMGDGAFHGHLNLTPDEFLQIFSRATDTGWPVGVHTAGDGAEGIVIDAFAKVLSERPHLDIRHHLMHLEVPLPDEYYDRMAQYGIGVVQQTNFLWSLEGLYDDYLWPVVRRNVAPAGRLIEHGVTLANSSDVIPSGPMTGLYTSVTRRGRSGKRYAYEEERLDLKDAIRAYTIAGAYQTHQEDVKGSLEAGKYADFIVLSHDIFRVHPDHLQGVRVNETYVGGKHVYSRPEKERPSTKGREATMPSGGREGGPEEFVLTGETF